MRNSHPLVLRSREVFASELNITNETAVRYFDGQKLVYISINLQVAEWGKRAVFRSEWTAQFERGHKIIYPLSAHEIPNVAEERAFSLMHDCDATTGIFIKGAKSIYRTMDDVKALTDRVEMVYRLSNASMVTAVNALRRLLRVHTPVARSLLERRPAAQALVTAALPHFAAQARAARDWLARKGPLAMDMTGAKLLESL